MTTTIDTAPGAGAGVDVFGRAQQAACDQLTELIGRAAACRATGVARSTYYHHHRVSPAPPRPVPKPHVERIQPRALAPAERQRVHVAEWLESILGRRLTGQLYRVGPFPPP
ncbi:MAG: hypothetical protein ABS81_08295 [Pseudonocardia sp. SCN 72-86]|nr:MAG: hypothetical protein ABS81_08295 [Pseudonocardia sp. SCN 72-86]